MSRFEDVYIKGKDILDVIYPVGTLYYTEDDNFDPNVNFNGTWELIKGAFILSVDPDDADINISKKVGGEKEHLLTTAEMPSHNHTFKDSSHTIYWGQSGCNVYFSNSQATAGKPPSNNPSVKQGSWTYTNNTGGGNAHNNMPPYYTAYVWRRIK